MGEEFLTYYLSNGFYKTIERNCFSCYCFLSVLAAMLGLVESFGMGVVGGGRGVACSRNVPALL